jgi:hypothetical protein
MKTSGNVSARDIGLEYSTGSFADFLSMSWLPEDHTERSTKSPERSTGPTKK